jgi:uncharacterized membrane protein YtjA (UPF0391 family)
MAMLCVSRERTSRLAHNDDPKGGPGMLSSALVFLIFALIAAVLGFWGLAGLAATIAKILFFIFLVLFVIRLLFRTARSVDV